MVGLQNLVLAHGDRLRLAAHVLDDVREVSGPNRAFRSVEHERAELDDVPVAFDRARLDRHQREVERLASEEERTGIEPEPHGRLQPAGRIQLVIELEDGVRPDGMEALCVGGTDDVVVRHHQLG